MTEDKKQDYFVHSQGICESNHIGAGTRIWAFAHVLPDAVIGADCNICDHTFVENDVLLGDRVTIKCGVQLWDGVTLEDDVFVGPNVTFTNDRFPRSRQRPAQYLRTRVCRNASIGANATILPGITIGMNAMIGAGSTVTRDVPPHAIVVGSPAHITGYVATPSAPAPVPAEHAPESQPNDGAMNVNGARLYQLPVISDMRGTLSVAEYVKDFPFIPRRYFVIYDVPSQEVRGEHAHKETHQFLVCLRGSCHVCLDDGCRRETVILSAPNIGLYIPPMVWGSQFRYSGDALLLVLASQEYDSADYIRDYQQFLTMI